MQVMQGPPDVVHHRFVDSSTVPSEVQTAYIVCLY